MKTRTTQSGFTLLEISIAMTIIGLIVGGTLLGREILRASELRAIVTQADKYKIAISTFKDTYNALPGDMPNAMDYWGVANGTTAPNYSYTGANNCFSVVKNQDPTTTNTCNGDGDGKVSGGATNWAGLPNNPEQFAVWHQLANANLITGIYSSSQGGYQGVAGAWGSYWSTHTKGWGNMPSFKGDTTRAFAFIHVCGWLPNSYLFYNTICGHIISFGGIAPTMLWNGAAFPAYPALTPPEAYSIDAKFDDGKPGTGKITSLKYMPTGAFWGSSCTDSGTPTAAKYKTSNSSYACPLFFLTDF